MDIANCYKCFYWFELLCVMGWLISGWIVSITLIVTVNDYQDTLDSAQGLADGYANCSNDLINDLVQTVTIDSQGRNANLVIWYMVLGLFCIFLWPIMFLANCKFVTE